MVVAFLPFSNCLSKPTSKQNHLTISTHFWSDIGVRRKSAYPSSFILDLSFTNPNSTAMLNLDLYIKLRISVITYQADLGHCLSL